MITLFLKIKNLYFSLELEYLKVMRLKIILLHTSFEFIHYEMLLASSK